MSQMKIWLDKGSGTVAVQGEDMGRITSQTVEAVLLYFTLKLLSENARVTIEELVRND
jgi:hypothetical protein